MARVDPIFRDIELIVSDLTSPEARSARLAEFAAEQIEEVRQNNRAVVGRDLPYEVVVDGKVGVALTAVKPNGVIVANFDLLREVLEWIGEQLLLESPRLTGRYMRSHVMFVDGVEHDLDGPIPPGESYEFVNTQPYARKMEPRPGGAPQSDQAPKGVYHVLAAVAQKRFGNIARVRYSFRAINGEKGSENRQPAIVVRPY
jgi:hypothetical protein